MKRKMAFTWAGVMAVLMVVAAAAADKTKSEQAFDRLALLSGKWGGKQDSVKISLTYTVTADGSVLMEEFRPESGPVMITMFSVDGDHMVATHYCAARNQPQMVTSAITDVQMPLIFSLVRITGLKSPDDFHNTGLTVIQEDRDHLTQEWTYQYKGNSGKNTLRFTRARQGTN